MRVLLFAVRQGIRREDARLSNRRPRSVSAKAAHDLDAAPAEDRGLAPAVRFLDQKGLRVIQAGFPPHGVDLATSCWGSFNVYDGCTEIERPDARGPSFRQ